MLSKRKDRSNPTRRSSGHGRPPTWRSDEATAGTAESDERTAGTDGARDAAGVEQMAAGSQPVDAEAVVELLHAKVERLGAVNMMAIDQFDELEERHGFLTAQRQDLIDSISATGAAIKRIDRHHPLSFPGGVPGSSHEHFQLTFQTLFGGGRAELVLLDESDVLESGIDIAAQPPGKRLQSIQLLSGGEKALTAMALMFAILQVPGRVRSACWTRSMRPWTTRTSGASCRCCAGCRSAPSSSWSRHNRKTMEIADRLYGITMEEPGVSKLISVNMAQTVG